MTRMRRLLACLVLLLLAGSPALLRAADSPFVAAGIENEQEAYDFLQQLQTALQVRDRAAVAALLSNHVNVYRDGKREIRTAKALMAQFEEVFDPYVTAVILCQRPGSLWANWRGISIGRGTVWFGLELQVSRQAYDANPAKYPASDRRYWKMKLLTINMGRYAEEQSARCS